MKSSQDKKKRFSMNKYLSVLITLLIFGGFGASAEETKLIPLTEYIKISDPNDEFTWEFMSKRCAGISFTLATRWYRRVPRIIKKVKKIIMFMLMLPY